MNSSLNLFLIGLGIGAFVAAAGGLIEYWLHLRRKREPFIGVPSCLLYTVGGLVLAGVVALITSLIVTGGVGPALLMGAGVLTGFYVGFMLLVATWLVLDRRRAVPDLTPTPDAKVQEDKHDSATPHA